ncbi:DUF3526 domain-containing protein [Sphingobacterium sp. NGMCC 1.201703]|uniref:DUF3526 domain-containing protein n=1 Tax=Sphingobacterium sp. NGMCC 1.201703 TaxID=3388657 RepID=UPI0039FBE2DA
MNLLKLIFRFEWKQFIAQPLQLALLFFFLLLGGYSLYTGKHFVQQQCRGLDTLQRNQQRQRLELMERFESDTNSVTGKNLAAQAGLPQVVEYRASPVATNPPSALAMMAIGQRDILPYYDVVNSKRDFFTPPNTAIANPEKLAAGNFDLSFVLVYLIPLLIIVLSYDLFAREKEQQTDRLLRLHGGSLRRILLYKLLFRFGLLCLLLTALNGIGFMMAPRGIPNDGTDFLLWNLATLSYLLFWCALAWLMILYGSSSRKSALLLLGCWLGLTIVLPALCNRLVGLRQPLPLRTELVSKQRATMLETWEMPIPELIEQFYSNNPQYVQLRKPTDTARYGNKRFVAYYDLLGRRMDKNIRIYQQGVQLHQHLLDRTGWFNPVTQMQSLLNEIAQTGLASYLHYQRDVAHFQHRWVLHMNGFLLRDAKLSKEDLKVLPQFSRSADSGRLRLIGWKIGSILLLTLFVSGAAVTMRPIGKND